MLILIIFVLWTKKLKRIVLVSPLPSSAHPPPPLHGSPTYADLRHANSRSGHELGNAGYGRQHHSSGHASSYGNSSHGHVHHDTSTSGWGTVGGVQATDDFHTRGAGTWLGQAPKAQKPAPTYCTDADSNKSTRPTGEPRSVLLPGGLRLPVLGLGTYSIPEGAVLEALKLGYRHLDCASIYANQVQIGTEIKRWCKEEHGVRSDLFVTTKFWNDEQSPEAVKKSCEKSINDLQVGGYIDLLLWHWPISQTSGVPAALVSASDLEVTWRAMEALVDAGLVKTIGMSNFPLRFVEQILCLARIKPAVLQVESHPYLPLRKMVGVCRRKGIQMVAYSPLGCGAFVPEHTKFNSPKGTEVVARIAKETGRSQAQVLLKWNTQRGVVVIPKASSAAHLRDNWEGHFDWRLTTVQKQAMDDLEVGEAARTCIPDFAKEVNLFTGFEEGGALRPAVVFGYDK